MIGSLKGTVDSLGIDNCIIETAGGVGYRVFLPAAQLAQLTQGAAVRLLCRKFRYINGFHAFLPPFSALFSEVSDRATFQLRGASSVLYHNAAGK